MGSRKSPKGGMAGLQKGAMNSASADPINKFLRSAFGLDEEENEEKKKNNVRGQRKRQG